MSPARIGIQTAGGYRRYNYDHAKYIIRDNKSLIIETENWGESSVPVNGTVGNRGWGIIMESSELAEYYNQVFNYDWLLTWSDMMCFNDKAEKYCIPETNL